MGSVNIDASANNNNNASKSNGKKRKWREIEAIHDKYRLQKELSDMDVSLELELEQLTR
ncbi:MAG: DUF3545 family protein [Pseudomonadota bacterium]